MPQPRTRVPGQAVNACVGALRDDAHVHGTHRHPRLQCRVPPAGPTLPTRSQRWHSRWCAPVRCTSAMDTCTATHIPYATHTIRTYHTRLLRTCGRNEHAVMSYVVCIQVWRPRAVLSTWRVSLPMRSANHATMITTLIPSERSGRVAVCAMHSYICHAPPHIRHASVTHIRHAPRTRAMHHAHAPCTTHMRHAPRTCAMHHAHPPCA
jgi:hypothetical protein